MEDDIQDSGSNNPVKNTPGIGQVIETEISQEMKKSYLDYAMSVIVSRALPDVKDGLKPVQRRILYSMHNMGLTHSSRYTKSAKVVGECMGKFHPHGDMAIYDALVRMAQDFSLRYPLIDGHGNFGSVDGDPPAAMRYTEVRMAAISNEMLQDIHKETVPFSDNFDASIKEPVYLPAKLPNLLLMGADGIAVGMATKIPPHNLVEVIDAIALMIKKSKVTGEKVTADDKTNISDPENIEPQKLVGEFETGTTIEELLEHIQGPDFPTGGEIYDWSQIKEVYSTGRGKIVIRGKTAVVEDKNRFKILITEIPYQVNKARLIKKIADLVKNKKIKGIADIRDESDRRGMQVAIELKKEGKPKAILNNLYKQTELQTSFPANMVALVDGAPQLLNLKSILTEYIKHRQLVTVRRSQHELKNARLRAHILEGLKICLDNLDAVIETIKKSQDADVAKANLMKKFKLTDIQATAILDMQLRRLAALERQKIEEEYKMIQELIGYLTDLLLHPEKVLKVIVQELDYLKKKYGDQRRTKVYKKSIKDFSEEDLVEKKDCLVTITKSGYIKRLPVTTYRSQRRGGKGVTGMTTKEEDEIVDIRSTNTHDEIFFFTDRGRVFKLKVHELPEGSRQSKGQAIINLISIDQNEQVQVVLTVKKQESKQYLFLATKNGIVKKSSLQDFQNIRADGLIAIRLKGDDRLMAVIATSNKDNVLLVSHNGKAIKFDESQVRPMGRATTGMKGLRLKKEDFLVGAEAFPPMVKRPKDKRRKFFQDILAIMEKGIGKRTSVDQFPLQKRAGIGVKIANVSEKTGKVVSALLVTQEIEQVVLTSTRGQVIKLALKNIPQLRRASQGVILMRFTDKADRVAAVAFLKKEET